MDIYIYIYRERERERESYYYYYYCLHSLRVWIRAVLEKLILPYRVTNFFSLFRIQSSLDFAIGLHLQPDESISLPYAFFLRAAF